MRRRSVVALLALAAAGCAYSGGPAQDSITFNTGLAPDSVIRIADAYLVRSGFAAVRHTPRVLTTMPKETAAGADSDATTGHRFRHWMLRIDAGASVMQGGTDVRVAGYYLPDASPSATIVDSTAVTRAVPVSAANAKLFAQIDAIASKLKELTVTR
ncbi:MAG: hypothetical protein ABJD07_08135 [Gemmatimonadaceae bacterium]